MSVKKFINVELIICYFDNTWNTDYVLMESFEEAVYDDFHQIAIDKWSKEQDARLSQCTGLEPSIVHIGVYNINWDEFFNEKGDPIDEDISKCFQCKKDVCFERYDKSFPEEYEVCIECEEHFCNNCIDWLFMKEKGLESPICKQCVKIK